MAVSNLDSNLFIITFLTLHPEWIDEVKLVKMDGEVTFHLSLNCVSTFTAWSAKEGICEPEKAKQFLGFLDQFRKS